MKFKRIYIEITNICNLNCSFCISSNKARKTMTTKEFITVLDKINNYTDYIYLHVKGEPLLYKDLDEILSISKKYHKKVCITTNGMFLKDKLNILNKYDNIYQINISLHSENYKDNYLEDIFYSVDKLKYPYISYRFWTLDKGKMDSKTNSYLEKIIDKYHTDKIYSGVKLKDKVYLSLEDKFTWPSTHNDYIKDGYCRAIKSQLGILSDGTVIVCCLDTDGLSNLGNIYKDDLEDILSSSKYQNIINNFNNNKAYLDICKHCSYKERFNNKN